MRQTYATTREHLEIYCSDLLEQYPDDKSMPEFGIHFQINDGQRTLKQNSAMHKYFALLATALNDAGLDMRKLLKAEVDIPWTPISVKESLWRPIQEVVKGERSTTKLERKDVSEIYEILTRHLTQKHGISVPFPQRDYG